MNHRNSSPSSNDGTALYQKNQALSVKNSDSITALAVKKQITKRLVHVNNLYEKFKSTSWMVNQVELEGDRKILSKYVRVFPEFLSWKSNCRSTGNGGKKGHINYH